MSLLLSAAAYFTLNLKVESTFIERFADYQFALRKPGVGQDRTGKISSPPTIPTDKLRTNASGNIELSKLWRGELERRDKVSVLQFTVGHDRLSFMLRNDVSRKVNTARVAARQQ